MAEPRRLLAVGVAGVLLATACGTDSGLDSDPGATAPAVRALDAPTTADPADRELAGIVRAPAPQVDATTVPSLTNPGEDAVFRAESGGFLAIYFGYTNCPDVCPTTMADWAVALRRLPPELAGSVGTLMVTVDPERDNELLPDYVTSFVADAEAAGTTDADVLAAAAEPFGVSYDVITTDDGEIEVSHSGFLYLVDDEGRLRVTWPFGLSSRDMAADVLQLFETAGPA
jgi:protein SCO1/2